MATVGIELNNKSAKDGRHAILLRLTKDRKSARYKTNISVLRKDYNPATRNMKWIRTSEPYYNAYNDRLKTLYKDLEMFWTKLVEDNPRITASEIIRGFKKRHEGVELDWIKYFDSVIDSYAGRNKVRYSMRIKAIRNKLEKYIGTGNSIRLEDTTLTWLKGFEQHLYGLGNSVNTVGGNIKVIKQIYKSAIDEDLIEKPNLKVLSYSLKSMPVERDKLDAAEIAAIEQVQLEERSLIVYRDFFLFAYYCAGMRFSDCATLKWKNIDGEFLKYRMAKNYKLQNLKLPKQAKAILSRCSTPDKRRDEDFIFKFLPRGFNNLTKAEQVGLLNTLNVHINKDLKTIARMAKVRKRVSLHTARHSFAYNAFKKTKDVLAVQSLLQHSKLKETQDYITSLTNEKERDILGEIFD